MKIQIVDARPEWAPKLAEIVRKEQVEEITKYGEDTLREQIERSVISKVGFVNEVPAIVWGVLMPSLTNGTAVLWALTTRHVEDHPFVFARHSKLEIERLRSTFAEIVGVVDCDFRRSIRWLRWLGFEAGEPYRFHGKLVRKVTMKGAL